MSSTRPVPADRQLPRGHLLVLNRSFRRTLEAENKSPRTIEAYTDADIAEHAREIYLQAGRSHAMPPGNVTDVTEEERALIVAWFEGAGK